MSHDASSPGLQQSRDVDTLVADRAGQGHNLEVLSQRDQ